MSNIPDVEDNLFNQKLQKAGFSNEEIVKIHEIIDSTCMECLNSDKGCYCWNDD